MGDERRSEGAKEDAAAHPEWRSLPTIHEEEPPRASRSRARPSRSSSARSPPCSSSGGRDAGSAAAASSRARCYATTAPRWGEGVLLCIYMYVRGGERRRRDAYELQCVCVLWNEMASRHRSGCACVCVRVCGAHASGASASSPRDRELRSPPVGGSPARPRDDARAAARAPRPPRDILSQRLCCEGRTRPATAALLT